MAKQRTAKLPSVAIGWTRSSHARNTIKPFYQQRAPLITWNGKMIHSECQRAIKN